MSFICHHQRTTNYAGCDVISGEPHISMTDTFFRPYCKYPSLFCFKTVTDWPHGAPRVFPVSRSIWRPVGRSIWRPLGRFHNILHPSDFLNITSQNARNSIFETLNFKIFGGAYPRTHQSCLFFQKNRWWVPPTILPG